MLLELKAKNRTREENIAFLKSVRQFYKLGPKCDKFNINKSNLYNVLNKKSLTVRPELINAIVDDVINELSNFVKDYIDIEKYEPEN